MKIHVPYTLEAELEFCLTPYAELIEEDLEQSALFLEEAICITLLQLVGNGEIVVVRFSLQPSMLLPPNSHGLTGT